MVQFQLVRYGDFYPIYTETKKDDSYVYNANRNNKSCCCRHGCVNR